MGEDYHGKKTLSNFPDCDIVLQMRDIDHYLLEGGDIDDDLNQFEKEVYGFQQLIIQAAEVAKRSGQGLIDLKLDPDNAKKTRIGAVICLERAGAKFEPLKMSANTIALTRVAASAILRTTPGYEELIVAIEAEPKNGNFGHMYIIQLDFVPKELRDEVAKTRQYSFGGIKNRTYSK